MNKNKYLIFASIGFELIALILLFIYFGDYLVDKQGWPQTTKAFGIVIAFGLWITSLVVKLKSLENSKKND